MGIGIRWLYLFETPFLRPEVDPKTNSPENETHNTQSGGIYLEGQGNHYPEPVTFWG